MLSTAAVVNTPVFKDGGQTTLMCCNVAILCYPSRLRVPITLNMGWKFPSHMIYRRFLFFKVWHVPSFLQNSLGGVIPGTFHNFLPISCNIVRFGCSRYFLFLLMFVTCRIISTNDNNTCRMNDDCESR